MINPVLDQAARQTAQAGVPERMPEVYRVYDNAIAELRRIDKSTPDIHQARQDMASFVAAQQLKLDVLLDKNTTLE